MLYAFEDAKCATRRKSWPWDGTATDRPDLWEAAAVACSRCSCRMPCAALGLSNGYATGMFAGVRVRTNGNGRDALRAVVAAIEAV